MNKNSLYRLLNIHASEAPVVFRLLGIQAVLGLATAFLTSASYSLFLYHFPVTKAPTVYLLAAVILFPVNALYARLDLKLNSKKLLQLAIVFAASSMSVLLILWAVLKVEWLVIFFVAWNLMLYMVVGYAYWGLASLLFNVRESRRIFSVIGAGDLPAKAVGYYVVAVLAPITGINLIMAAAIVFFFLAYFLCKKLFAHSAIDWESYETESHHVTHEPIKNWWERLFENKLIQWIAALSLVAYIVFYLVEFTFLSEVKIRYHSAHELSAFIGLFFATGRIISIFVKLLFTSRLINRLGLTKSLLITPLLIIGIAISVLMVPMADPNGKIYLYAFGIMAIFCEVLRNTIQEPVFFILFQPLSIHLRLKGHLVAKGYVFPPALVIVGTGLSLWLYLYNGVSILTVLMVVVALIGVWLFTIKKIGTYYIGVVQSSIQKGFFSGIALFLNEDRVIEKLVFKTKSGKSIERINALNLLERSNYRSLEALMNELLVSGDEELQQYVLERIQHYRYHNSLKAIQLLMGENISEPLRETAFKTICALDSSFAEAQLQRWNTLSQADQISLAVSIISFDASSLQRHFITEKLSAMATSGSEIAQLQLLEIIEKLPAEQGRNLLGTLKATSLTNSIYNRFLAVAGGLEATQFLPELFRAFNMPASRQTVIVALGNMKEKLFAALPSQEKLTSDLLEQLAFIAGKTKDAASTDYLLQLFDSDISAGIVANALWQKQYSTLPTPGHAVFEQTNKLLLQLAMKKQLWQQIDNPAHKHLSSAVFSEIETDCMAVLQLIAMQYGREKLMRVIELMDMHQYGKMHNAIELLELSIPRTLFAQLETVLDFIIKPLKEPQLPKQDYSFLKSASSILGNPGQFNDWTKSLTWWLASREQDLTLLSDLATFDDPGRSQILKETKEFVFFGHNYN